MRSCKIVLVWVAWTGISAFVGFSQTPSPAGTGASASAKGASAPAAPFRANLAQLMRGILYPSSNVIFFAQNENPADVKPAKDPSLATDPLASSYGKWLAVENSALALVEAANLLTLPGRKCGNGRDVPIRNADWPKFVQGLREAGLTAYKAAQSKNMDNMLMAAGDDHGLLELPRQISREAYARRPLQMMTPLEFCRGDRWCTHFQVARSWRI